MDYPKLDLGSLKDKVSSALKTNPGADSKPKKSGKNARADKKQARDGKSKVPKPEDQKSHEHHHKKDHKKDHKKEHKSDHKSDHKHSEHHHHHHDDAKNEENEFLRKEARELGATEEDIKLVEDLDDEESEQEFEETQADSGLQHDVKDFMKSLGLEDSSKLAVIADEEAAEDEEEEEAAKADEKASRAEEEDEEEIEEEIEAGDDSEEAEEGAEEAEEEEAPAPAPTPALATPAPGTSKRHQMEENIQTVKSSRLAVPAQNDWYNIPLNLKSDTADRSLRKTDIDELYAKAEEIVKSDNAIYDEELNRSSSQRRFLAQMLTNGTLNDKISALTLLVQEAPLHNVQALDNLLGMCNKKSRNAASQCVSAVVDLFVSGVIPPERKLKYFKNQPLQREMTDEQLAIFWFEDYLKNWYFEFVAILEKLSHDSMEFVRVNTVGHIFSLLKAKPEQEANLLRLGVNKIGDTENRVSSKTSYEIQMLEQQHPAMKQIVSDAVIDVMFRNKNEQHAIYYAIVTLNQTILTKSEEKLANKLVNAYFALFEKLLVQTDNQNVGQLKESEHTTEGRHKRNMKRGKKGGKSVKKEEKSEQELQEERNSKTFSAILTGLNRAFPFSDLPAEVFEKHLETLYRITHSANFNTSVQALLLIHNIVSSKNKGADRFYRTLYESLLDDRLLTSSKQGIYLNLLFKALKEDTDKARVMAFVKRISQVCLSWLNVGTISGMLFLLVQLERNLPELRNLFYNSPEEEKEKGEKEEYDPRKRDPKHAHADNSSLWEIEYFLRHYHPTVELYAESLNDGKKVAKPDLGLFTLGHFLDRFVYKKPKQRAVTRGHSIMQPLGGPQTGNLLVKSSDAKGLQQVPANTQQWMNRRVKDIKPEDRFFYQYFASRQEKEDQSKFDRNINNKIKEPINDDGELDEDDVWKALVASNPEVEADEDEGFSDLSDLEAADFSDDDDEDEDEEDVELPELDDEVDEEEEEEEGEGLVPGSALVADGSDEDEEVAEDESNSDDDEFEDARDETPIPDNDEESSDDDDLGDLIGEESDELDSEEEVEELQEEESKKLKRAAGEDGKKRKKRVKLSSLPTFASVDDYANLLDDDE